MNLTDTEKRSAVVQTLTNAIKELVAYREMNIARSLTDELKKYLNNDNVKEFDGIDVTNAVNMYTQGGDKVAAIKELRRLTGCQLATAKNFVESFK